MFFTRVDNRTGKGYKFSGRGHVQVIFSGGLSGHFGYQNVGRVLFAIVVHQDYGGGGVHVLVDQDTIWYNNWVGVLFYGVFFSVFVLGQEFAQISGLGLFKSGIRDNGHIILHGRHNGQWTRVSHSYGYCFRVFSFRHVGHV